MARAIGCACLRCLRPLQSPSRRRTTHPASRVVREGCRRQLCVLPTAPPIACPSERPSACATYCGADCVHHLLRATPSAPSPGHRASYRPRRRVCVRAPSWTSG
eukprot:5901596-Prymnesium_polylepis.1